MKFKIGDVVELNDNGKEFIKYQDYIHYIDKYLIILDVDDDGFLFFINILSENTNKKYPGIWLRDIRIQISKRYIRLQKIKQFRNGI